MPDQKTLPELVRAKYPGAYDDLNDAQLDTMVRAKFPGAYDDVPKPKVVAPASAHPVLDTAKDVAAGFAKAAGRTVQAVVDDVPHFFGGAGASDYIDLATGRPKGTSYDMVAKGQQPTNTAQRVGGAAETATELALAAVPTAKAVGEVLPSTARAGRAFGDVMGSAKSVPLDITETGDAALRIKQLSERGSSMPQAVQKLLQRMTDPNKGDLTFEEARDFYSNISRLSANEMGKLTPKMTSEVVKVRTALNKALTKAAESVGKGEQYAGAMKEYAKASQAKEVAEQLWSLLKKHAPAAAASGVGLEIYEKARGPSVSVSDRYSGEASKRPS
jgi:polyhydroxyalkanoate synthesis regulator phasin